MFSFHCEKMCVQQPISTAPPLDFDKFNWKEEGMHELLCESNYIEVDDQILVENNDLNIIHLNIRGINSKITKLNHLIECTNVVAGLHY